jgi:hypothetical protein
LASNELNQDVLKDAVIYGAEDEKIGTVSHLHGVGPSSRVVIDVGGFLGIGAKPVAIPIASLDFMRDEEGEVHAVTMWTKDQLKEMPEHLD